MYKKITALVCTKCSYIPIRFLLMMKLVFIMLLSTFMQVSASSFAQKVSISVRNAHLKDVFSLLRKQTGYDFLYNSADLNNSSKVSITASNEDLKDVLDKCLNDQSLTYTIKKSTVLVKRKVLTTSALQLNSITGKVTDEKDDPLPGVSVRVKGVQSSTVTDVNGNYKINVQKGLNVVLIFSYLGFATQEVDLGNKLTANIKLKPSNVNLDETIVVAYGTVSKRDLTGSVGEVNLSELQKAPVPKFEDALAGRVAGVHVGASDGQPGSEMNIVIRGGNSLTQSNAPLYVIDGFPSEEPVGNLISPSDIETINILKDASATALYGARGANGVIIIETKKAKASEPQINYNLTSGVNSVTKKIDLMSAYDFVKFQTELFPTIYEQYYLTNPGLDLEHYRNTQAVNWQDKLFTNSLLNIHDFSVSGGTNNTKYRASAGYTNQEGVLRNTGYDRFLGRLYLDQNVFKKGKLVLNVTGTKQKSYGEQVRTPSTTDGASYSTNVMYQIWGYRTVNVGDEDIEFDFVDLENGTGDLRVNPYANLLNIHNLSYTNSISANAKFVYDITSKLKFSTSVLHQSRSQLYERFNNSKTSGGFPSPGNLRGVNGSINNNYFNSFLNENLLIYKNRFKKKHNFEALAGYTYQKNETKSNGYASQKIPNENLGISGLDEGDITIMNSSITDNGLVSFLARVNYNYNSKYLFTFSNRWDGSSKFVKNKWGFFPSGAFAWNMKQESFLKNIRSISNSKLRFSYGITGNNRIPDYAFAPRLDMDYAYFYSFGNDVPGRGIVTTSMGNANLKWESTHQLDIGYDLSLFKDRINLTVDWYQKNTKDLLMNATMPISSGYTTVFKNIGSIENRGLEISLNTRNITNKNFSWSTEFNISFNRNKVTDLSEGQQFLETLVPFPRAKSDWVPLYRTEIGRPASAFYGYVWDGVYQYDDFNLVNGNYELKPEITTNGNSRTSIQPGDIKYVDLNGDKTINSDDRTYIGRTMPKHFGGLNNTFSYKGFSTSVFLQWSYGNDVFNANRMLFEGNQYNLLNLNQYASYADRWTPENQDSKIFRAGGFGPRGMLSSRTIEDASFLRLKTLSLSYSLPKSFTNKLKLSSVILGATAQNLYTITGYSGMDPEVSVRNSVLTPGFDFSAYPRERSIVFNLKVGL